MRQADLNSPMLALRTDLDMRSSKHNPPGDACKTSPTTSKGQGAELPYK